MIILFISQMNKLFLKIIFTFCYKMPQTLTFSGFLLSYIERKTITLTKVYI